MSSKPWPSSPSSTDANQWQSGRAPWYTPSGAQRRPFVLGMTGGTASGKTTVCRKVVEALGLPWITLLSMDRYYKSLTPEQLANVGEYNFDHPDSFDWDELRATLHALRKGQGVDVPRYDFATHLREPTRDHLYGADIVILEGIFVLFDKGVRDMLDMCVFVDTDADIRLARRLRRDIAERGRTVSGVLDQYEKTVKPSFDEFIAPTKRYADIIIPRGGDNTVAIDLLVQHLRVQLGERGVNFDAHMARLRQFVANEDQVSASVLPAAIHVLPQTPALVALHTRMRDGSEQDSDDFRDNVDRLCTLLFDLALSKLPSTPVQVQTPTGVYDGCDIDFSSLTVVSIVRGGDALSYTLKRMVPSARVGKIVVQQTSTKEDGPRFYSSQLPKGIQGDQVLLLTSLISTGNKSLMAIHVLKDHGVPIENIHIVCLIAAPQGLRAINDRFPNLNIVTSAIEDGLNERLFATPGIGSFGDRYFGLKDESDAYDNSADLAAKDA